MQGDPGSLSNLRDIAEPAPVSWWPLAAGWWCVIAVVVSVLATLLYMFIRRRQRNAYRRAALKCLRVAKTNTEISEVIKRTALSAFPRKQVASLAGAEWCDWLQSTSDISIDDPIRFALTDGVFASTDTSSTQSLQEFAKQWITTHNSPDDSEGASRK